MPHVVLLRGVNVGGHRTFRPSVLAKELAHLDVVNIGAAGTFVVRKHVGVTKVRAEFARKLPFKTEVMVCSAKEILALASRDFFARQPATRDVIRFVSVMARRAPIEPSPPFSLPERGRWFLRVLAQEGRFVIGVHRREMPAIRYLGTLDRHATVPLTTRNWNTITAIADVLKG